jgi:hypothetical protein
VVACQDVTPAEFAAERPSERIIEVPLRVSVRFHGSEANQVEEITVDVSGSLEGLSLYSFSPTTELASELADDIKQTTTVEKSHSLSGTLGGELPVVAGDLIAHVTPSISGGLGGRQTSTEQVQRRSPKHAVVVSGTTDQGRGVFFKLKRTSQNTLEGVHDLRISFIAPRDWQTGSLSVVCRAHGKQKLLGLVSQPKIFGEAVAPVYLHLAGNDDARQVAERRATEPHRHECCRFGTPNLADLLD